MKLTLSLMVFIFFGATSVSAYELSITKTEQPYEIITVEDTLEESQAFLGELKGFPVMYEVVVEDSEEINIGVRQRYYDSSDPYSFSLILIRQNERDSGVTEISRLRPEIGDWSIVKDSVTGMTFWESEVSSQTVEAGIYRVEISTSDNKGKYLLTFGSQELKSGYFQTIQNTRTTQKFFDYSVFRMLASSHIYYTLGVLILLFAIYRTWKYRNSISHAG